MKNFRHLGISIAVSFFTLVSPEAMHGQTAEQKQEIISAVGEEAGNSLITTHQAVNALGDGYVRKTYSEKEALDLANSYLGSAELCAKLVQGKSPRIEEAAALLVKQATALQAWIKIGDDSMLAPYKKFQMETNAKLYATVAPVPTGAPNVVELQITKSTGPEGTAGSLGTMIVNRKSDELPLEVIWTYADGRTVNGFAIPMPDTGKLAAFMGEGVRSISIYQRDGAEVKGRRVAMKEGSQIEAINLKQGESKAEYDIEGGGRMLLKIKPGMIADVTWTSDSGEESGIAIGDNKFLALAALEPGAKPGVALYTMTPGGGSATGRWVTPGASGAVEEELVITKMPGASAAGGSQAEAANGTVLDEVREIALKFRADLGAAAPYKPTPEEVAALAATSEDAAKLNAYVEKVYAQLTPGRGAAKEGQTEIMVGGPALSELPGGYVQKIGHFKKGVEFYRFKYVEPGKESGMAFDGLAKVDGRWIFIPKAWRAFDE